MNKQDIETLVQFNFWANSRIIKACEGLTNEAFVRDVEPNPGWKSLRDILVHTLDTEFGWRMLLQGENADQILQPADFPDLPRLKRQWLIEETAWTDYLAGLSNGDLSQRYGEDSASRLNVWQTIMHVVGHGIQHRSEAAFILTGYGCSPGELDFDLFLAELDR